MGLIALEGMKFFAHHGYYEEEQVLGNAYEVDVYLDVDFSKAAMTEDISQTINFETVFFFVKGGT